MAWLDCRDLGLYPSQDDGGPGIVTELAGSARFFLDEGQGCSEFRARLRRRRSRTREAELRDLTCHPDGGLDPEGARLEPLLDVMVATRRERASSGLLARRALWSTHVTPCRLGCAGRALRGLLATWRCTVAR